MEPRSPRMTRTGEPLRAVERGLEIISEASRHVTPDLKARTPHIPWRQIAAIGNLLRHEYQRADTVVTWNVVQEHLPALLDAVQGLILDIGLSEDP